MIGKTVSHYRITRKLGEGGMGAVYLAEDTTLDREVALKFLPTAVANNPEALARFEREAKSAAALHHPHIVTVYEIGEHEGHRFIAMAYIGGERLSDVIARKDLSVGRALDIAIQVCDGLDEAHRAGIIHRDIKPDNILFDKNGRALLADFGLATGGRMTKITQEGSTVGTLHYMSPEQARGESLDVRSDLFSVGAILYEMITSQLAFPGEHAAAIAYAVSSTDPQPLSRYNNEASPELERVVAKALSKDAGTRYQSAADLLADLRALRSQVGSAVSGVASSSHARPAATRRWSTRIPLIAASAVALVAAGFLVRALFTPSESQGAVAVLPFVNTSQDPDTEYLSAGVTESLINRLSTLSDLKVMSNHTVARYKENIQDPQAIGRELGVSTVLIGHVDTRRDKLVVGVELLNVEDGSQLWGDRFDRDKTDILAIEKDIVTRIAEKLRVTLSSEDAGRIAEIESLDPRAYNLYLKGRYFQYGTTEDGALRALDFFRQAVEIEPRFAAAYAGMGDSYVNRAWLSSAAREEMLPKARAALDRAMAIDDNLPEAYMLAGEIKLYFDWDWAGAEAAFKRAVELQPGSDVTHRRYASYLVLVKRTDEAIAEARKAQALDPLSVIATHELAFNLMCAGRYEEAVVEFKKAIELNPNWIWGNIKLSMSYSWLGEHEKALAAVARADELLEGSPGSPLAQHWRAHVELAAGNPQRMKDTLARLLEQSKTGFVDPFILSLVYHDLGQYDQSLDALEQAFAMHSPLFVYLKYEEKTFLKNIAADPRFQKLMEQMKFPSGEV